MKLITQRDAIKQAIAEFRAQWGDGTYSADKRGRQVGRELAALDAETVERAVVDEIIGNASWTRMSCGECGDEDADAIIEVGEEPDYESAAARLCYRCIAKCAALAHNAQAEAEADGMQPSRPKPHMPVSPLGREDFCFCDNHVSLQSISGGLAPEGYLGSVRLNIDGEFVSYVRADLHAERARVPDGFFTDLQQAKNTAERSSKIDRLRVYGRVVEKHINALLAAAPSQPEDAADKEIQP